MNITTASALITSRLQAGAIDSDTAQRAQAAIRGKHYGKTMTADDRRRMLANRFGIAA